MVGGQHQVPPRLSYRWVSDCLVRMCVGLCAWVWSGVLWVGEGSGIIVGVWVSIFCVELYIAAGVCYFF